MDVNWLHCLLQQLRKDHNGNVWGSKAGVWGTFGAGYKNVNSFGRARNRLCCLKSFAYFYIICHELLLKQTLFSVFKLLWVCMSLNLELKTQIFYFRFYNKTLSRRLIYNVIKKWSQGNKENKEMISVWNCIYLQNTLRCILQWILNTWFAWY